MKGATHVTDIKLYDFAIILHGVILMKFKIIRTLYLIMREAH